VNIVPVLNFGLSAHRADYYGYRFCLHFGWRLIFIFGTQP